MQLSNYRCKDFRGGRIDRPPAVFGSDKFGEPDEVFLVEFGSEYLFPAAVDSNFHCFFASSFAKI